MIQFILCLYNPDTDRMATSRAFTTWMTLPRVGEHYTFCGYWPVCEVAHHTDAEVPHIRVELEINGSPDYEEALEDPRLNFTEDCREFATWLASAG